MSNGNTVHDTGQTKFENWHHNFEVRLRRRLDVWNADPAHSTVGGYNQTTATLQGLIAESLAVNERLRALGGTWSFSRAAAVDGTLINTKPLNYRFPIAPSAVSAQFQGQADNLYFVQAGISIADLNWYLFDRDKSLPTSGASNGQTMAGALSANTHGAAIDVGAIPDYVVALHLVVSPTKSVWLERASNPVVLNSRLPDRLGAVVIRDDAVFNAALVSFGSFGLLHGVVLEVSNKYFLNAFRRTMSRGAALRATMGDLDFSRLNLPRPNDRPFHFQVVMNPFEPAKAYVTTMYRDAVFPPGATLPDPPSSFVQGDDALGIVGVLTDLFGDLTGALTRGLTTLGYRDYENKAGTPGQIFRDTSTRGHASSSGVGLPLGRVNEALDALFALHNEVRAPVLFACRYVRSTPATLGFTSHGARTCVLEIDGPQSSKVRTMLQRSWGRLRALGIPFTFHWGKLHDLTPGLTRNAYGDARVDAWIAARHQILNTPALRHTFSNEMLVKSGLDG